MSALLSGARGWLRLLVIMAVACLVLWILAEAVLWIFFPTPRYPVYRYQLENSYPGLPAKSSFEVDARELRSMPGAKGRAKEVSLLVLGGVLTYQPLQNAPETWWGQLSQRLEKQFPDTAFPVMVKTSSTASTATGPVPSVRDGLRWARQHMASVKPDVVIVGYGIWEALDLGPSYRFDPANLDMPIPKPNALKERIVSISQIARRVLHWRSLRSRAYQQRRALLGKKDVFVEQWRHRRGNYANLPEDVFPPPREAESNTDPMEEYLECLKRLRQEATKAGAIFIVVGEPTLYDDLAPGGEADRLVFPRWDRFPGPDGKGGLAFRPVPSWVYGELSRFHAAAEAWCFQGGIPFRSLNTYDVVPKTTENFFDDATLTNQGAARVGEQLAPLVEEALKKAKK